MKFGEFLWSSFNDYANHILALCVEYKMLDILDVPVQQMVHSMLYVGCIPIRPIGGMDVAALFFEVCLVMLLHLYCHVFA